VDTLLRIGTLDLATNLLLAPVARYCDLAFRLTIRPLGGVGLAYTDLVNPRGLLRRTRKSMELVETEPADRPLCVQLYGSQAEEMAGAARWCEGNGASVIDINMGCPVEKVCKRAGGAALLRDPRAAVALAAHVVKAVRIPVTAKTRLGWNEGDLVAPELARALEDVGIAAVTVHGRSAAAGFTGHVRLDGIAHVVEAVRSIPVIGNGDVGSPRDVKKMIDRTGCAGVMIGRAALRDPWILRDSHALLTTGSLPPAPTFDERLAMMNEHFRQLVRLRGERPAVLIFRQRVSWYVGKLGLPREVFDRLRALSSAAEYWELAGTLGA
jgi:tRNA-dihydrouridine synthase B